MSETFSSLDQVLSAIFDKQDNCKLYLNMLIRNLEYLQFNNLVRECLMVQHDVNRDKIIELHSLIEKETYDIVPELVRSVLFYVTGLSYNMTENDLINKLRSTGLCTAARNIITPECEIMIPCNFKGKLYPPQSGILKRMLEIEDTKFVIISDEEYSLRIGVLSERVGFGKTHLCASLIAHKSKIDLDNFNIITSKVSTKTAKTIPEIPNDIIFNPKTININIVICNLKTLKEWEQNLSTLTNLSVTKITSAKMLEIFSTDCSNGKVPDVLLIKDGKIAGKVLIETITELFGNNLVNRVIIDDYDVLNMDKSISLPCARFYWLVSSTRCFGNKKSSRYRRTTNYKNNVNISSIENGMNICDNFTNIKCIDSFLSKEYNVPFIELYERKCIVREEIFCQSCQMHEDAVNDLMSQLCDADACDFCNKCQRIWIKLQELDNTSTFCDKCKALLIKSNSTQIENVIEDFLLNGTSKFDKKRQPAYFRKLIQGSANHPFDQSMSIKALFLAESNENWDFKNIKTVGITSNNIRYFESSEHQLGICSTMSGVNLSYITHIIVTDISSTDHITQFIGRAQRLNRKTNLRVLFLSEASY